MPKRNGGPITRTQNRKVIVEQLIDAIGDGVREVGDAEPMEIVSALLTATQRAMRFVVKHSDDHQTRMLNQGVLFTAIDGMKLAVTDETDPKGVN